MVAAPGRAGDVDADPVGAGRRDVERGDDAAGDLDGWVSSLTAVGRAGSSRRMVIEYETLAPLAMGVILP